MKNLLTYLKYLIVKPIKILWLLVVNILVQLMGLFVFNADTYQDNGLLVMWGLGIFITAIFVVANLQPYIEWRDGLEKPKK